MTDEHGMLRNGSIDSVGTAGRELNSDSTPTSSSAPAPTTNSVNTTQSNNDGNNNDNSTVQNSDNNDRQSQSLSHSPIDTENGNSNADNFVNSGCANNGNYSSGTSNGSNANSKQPNTNYTTNSNNGSPLHNVCGGRLQFFKDGKFILELARSKEGDRGWISVPRKTYWPPAALSQNNLNNHKNESSTSLSFSDDNSSIQSSPWQRDHSWKQLAPRKNISKDSNFYYYRPIAIVLNEASILISKHIRRQPTTKKNLNSVKYAKRNVQKTFSSRHKQKSNEFDALDKDISNDEVKVNIKKEDSGDVVDNANGKSGIKSINDDEKMDYKADDEPIPKLEQKKNINNVKFENCIMGAVAGTSLHFRKRHLLRSSKLSNVIEKLIARVSDKPMNVTTTQTGLGIHFSSTSRPSELFFPHQHVSPRKRILREFEKVSLEDRNLTTQKRSRSKSNVSNDSAIVGNAKPTGSNYSIVIAQQTANISCNNKEENNQVANGSPPSSHLMNSVDVSTLEKTLKNSRPLISTNSSKNNHVSNEPSQSQPISKPISNYSIISLLGHNNSSNNSDIKNETNSEDRTMSENRGSSSRSPMSYNHQMMSSNRSTYVSKKKSPPNSGNTVVNSPTNYRSARSPDINSPSPGLQHNSHHSRYHPASLSSPTSSFHPYLSSSRASPQSSGTLSPTDLYRHRSYRTAGSPSTMSNSSVSGLTHQYTPLNGSPTAFANRYSPSTYSSSTKTSPTQSSQSQSSSSTYNMNTLLPQNYDVNTSGVGENHRYSPNVKPRPSDWSPARNSIASGRGSPSNYANSNNSLSTTTIPKKTASIRQKYGSLSPNGFASGSMIIESTSSNKIDPNSGNNLLSDPLLESKPLAKRSRSPTESHKKPQQQELYEKDLQARYNAEVAAMHHQSLIASALHQQAAGPFYHMYSAGSLNAANLPPSMSAAYMNPLYYHHPASEIFRKTNPSAAMDLLHKNLVPSWIDPYNASLMHYPSIPGSGLISDKSPLAAKSQSEVHSMLMSPYSLGRSISARDQQSIADIEAWNAANNKRSPVTPPAPTAGSAFKRQSHQFSEPISLIKDEPSSDVPLNLSKH